MSDLAILFACFFSGISLIVNAEATVMLAASVFAMEPMFAGAAAAFGQAFLLLFLYRYGGGLALKWKWLQKKTDKARRRYEAGLEKRFLFFGASAALVGVPPVLAMAVLAPSFDARASHFIAIAIPLRFVRFWFVAALGAQLDVWIRSVI